MPERVVYVLGAGFSAPLGLPTVGNFLERSKDLYFREPAKYPEFKAVFDTINRLSVCKNYFKTDLFNIEEILSLLEMQCAVTDSKQDRQRFVKYICDVITAYTPPPPTTATGNWEGVTLGPGGWPLY